MPTLHRSKAKTLVPVSSAFQTWKFFSPLPALSQREVTKCVCRKSPPGYVKHKRCHQNVSLSSHIRDRLVKQNRWGRDTGREREGGEGDGGGEEEERVEAGQGAAFCMINTSALAQSSLSWSVFYTCCPSRLVQADTCVLPDSSLACVAERKTCTRRLKIC